MPSVRSPAFCTLFTAGRIGSWEEAQGCVPKCPEQLWEAKKLILQEPFYHLEPTAPDSLSHPLLLLTSPGTNQPSPSDFYSSTVIAIWAAFILNSTSEQYFQLCLTITRRDRSKKHPRWRTSWRRIHLETTERVLAPSGPGRPIVVPGPQGAYPRAAQC